MTKPALLMTGPMLPLIEDQLEHAFKVHRLSPGADREPQLAAIAPEIRAICTGGHTGVKTDAALIGRLPNLKIIGNFGVGYDSVDVAAAARRGIVVTNTPDVLTEEVADTAMGLLLMAVRELSKAERWVREGHWASKGDYRLTPATLRDRSVGVVGLGRIGKAIAKRCEGFGLPVSYFGRQEQSDVSHRYYSDLIAMARDVDTLVAIVPGGRGTRHLVDAEVLRALGPRGILVNVARGSVVDEDALVRALRDGTILGAGLDVFADEPRVPPALLEAENAVLIPHCGSATHHTRARMSRLVVDNLVSWFEGRGPLTPVPETPWRAGAAR